MSLRAQAESDLGGILEDGVYGFGWTITVTNPAGLSAELTGFSTDISQMIDPETGQVISGRLASVALRTSSLVTAGLGLPKGISDTTIKPWIVEFNDVNGNAGKFKIQQSNPDRALGIVTCLLEVYK